ncbi:sensor domain-containing protein [Bacteroidota bacterium]
MVVTGFSLSVGLLVIAVGFFIFIGTLLMIRGFRWLDIQLTRVFLAKTIPIIKDESSDGRFSE